ncbi:uncharacterized protein LOC133886630 [Phragmites australis]|uniref:uncharacterized protein LOC133886630 n=1 Tax=Phragmites australis TaxID=29695 RepID=UPI002D79CC60|nr:uncharacterized protein LOC133886630 [Phragmites australis]
MSQALSSRSRRLLLLLGVQSAHPGQGLGLRRLSSHHATAPYGAWYQQHEDGKAVKVTVWWDFQMCRLPPGVNPLRLGPRVTEALRRAGIRGPVEITAFGDVCHIPRTEQEALATTGVTFTHVPSSGKDGCDRSFMADLVYWIAQNPPPAHFFLISGDKDFANVLHRLRMSNYNVLLSCPDAAGSRMLRSAATFMWPWEALVKGVDLKPKFLNQPPDGLSCSWYGHYRGAVDDLLLKSKDPMALRRNTKVPKVPKAMVNGIKQVLHFYPEGVSVPNLRAELKRIDVFINKGVFGFKKLSALLQAMPDVVKFIDPLPGDCHPAVVRVYKRSVESSEQSFNRMDSAQSSIEGKCLNETESEELSSWDAQSSSSELPSCTEKKTLEADVTSSPSDQISGDQMKAPDLTTGAEPPSNRVEADFTLAADVPSPPSDALSRDQRNALDVDLVTQTEPRVSRTKADMVAAAGTPSSGVQGNVSKKGLFERISSIWNGLKAH